MKYIVKINENSYEVEVERGQASIVRTTEIADKTVHSVATVTQSQVKAAAQPVIQTNIMGEVIKSPMPGIILDIKTSPGAAVKKGQVLLILEAMKMENEITAPKDGVIAQIIASKGASVATGDILAAYQ